MFFRLFRVFPLLVVTAFLSLAVVAQDNPITPESKAKAAEIVSRAVTAMGGQNYLNVRSEISRGSYSLLRGNTVASFQQFTDAIVFPDRERAEFKGGGSHQVQVNTGSTGWVFDGDQLVIRDQTPVQIANFKEGLRTSLDNLLRGYWKGDAQLNYIGRRPATLGKRNDVIRLIYKDGFVVEFELAADDALPQKAIYKHKTLTGDEEKDEDRYAQFLDINGIKAPFVVDRYTDGSQLSRINYDSVEFNKTIPDSIFTKPASVKDAKKDVKY